MAKLIELPTHGDTRGKLTTVDGILPFDIKRVYYIYEVRADRGGHRHHQTWHAAVALNGSCQIDVSDSSESTSFLLDQPDRCLILPPTDWRDLRNFSHDAILLVMSSTKFDPDDYIYEPYK